MTKALVETEPAITAEDSLTKINDVITDKLKKFDVFDLNVYKGRSSAVKRVIKARGLEWRNSEFMIGSVIVLVVGVQGADFAEHERNR